MAYDLEGALLEVCTCDILCPCWVGEDPDTVPCQSIMAWHFEKGTIDGVDVGGHRRPHARPANDPRRHPVGHRIEGRIISCLWV